MKKIYTQCLKATVTNRWCLKQLNTFSVSGKKSVQEQIKLTDAWEGYSKDVVWQWRRLDFHEQY